MTLKRTVVRLLTKIYPRSWRDSYGPEIEAILLARPLTAAATLDVLRSATAERLRRAHPCRICAAFLLATTLIVVIWNSVAPFWPDPYAGSMGAVNAALLAAAFCATALRGDRLGRTMYETAKALFIGISPLILTMALWAFGALNPARPEFVARPGTGPHSMVFYLHPWPGIATNRIACLLTELFSLVVSGFIIGLVGGTLGRLTRLALRRATRA